MRRILLCVTCLLIAVPVSAQLVTLDPTRDATLYQDDSGSLANGAGQHLFTGRTASGNRRRTVLAFDIAGSIPAGSTITSASLMLNVSNVPPVVNAISVEIHRVTSSWTEGASNPPGQEGIGVPTAAGDTSWIHRSFPGDLWTADGGDFEAIASASEIVEGLGPVTWLSTPELVADVQAWLDTPMTNDGWILVGEGFGFQTAKRYDSREHPDAARRPQLIVEFQGPPPPTEIPVLSTWGLLLLTALLMVFAVRRLATR